MFSIHSGNGMLAVNSRNGMDQENTGSTEKTRHSSAGVEVIPHHGSDDYVHGSCSRKPSKLFTCDDESEGIGLGCLGRSVRLVLRGFWLAGVVLSPKPGSYYTTCTNMLGITLTNGTINNVGYDV
jgi:hypothetical protein